MVRPSSERVRDARGRGALPSRHERKPFHDPQAQSCTGFIAYVGHEKFRFDPKPLVELIKWAEIVHGAAFPDARTAVVMDEPAIRLMMIIEAPGIRSSCRA